MKKIGILTSGGDAPGMNAAIRAITKAALHYGIETVGIKDGFQGLLSGRFTNMKYTDVDNIIQRGGTILGSARCPEFKDEEQRKKAVQYVKEAKIEGLVIIGGDGSFMGVHVFAKEVNIPLIGLPATIDNDLYGTQSTIGYDTALNTIVSAIDNIRDTASSHKRVFFIEVMGRNSGFLALNSAIASGAESVLIPEIDTDLTLLAERIRTENKGRRSSIVIVAEGDDEGGAIDIKRKITPLLTDFELRTTVLGHIQRGGSPSYFDRSLATRSGVMAVELLMKGESEKMVGYDGVSLVAVPLQEAIENDVSPNLENENILKKLLTLG
ncbi:MAG TPA: 6-phosphofructokinase [Brumimicrobium sp.]|nr:6-phosphofructokinase [Brumimicrobium sp.]